AGYCNDIFSSAWNLFSNTGKFYLSISEASLEAMRTFNAELYSRCFDEENGDTEYTEAILERNAQFYERMAENSRNSYENFKRRKEETRRTAVEPIDYNKLARMVAEELRKNPS
ncbi:MAG: hypothetical protein WCF67_01660, partial [Chitinophagaceae bacterium]